MATAPMIMTYIINGWVKYIVVNGSSVEGLVVNVFPTMANVDKPGTSAS